MDPTPEMLQYRDRNIDQVADVLAIYHNTLSSDGVPHVLALQPMFRNCKKKRMPIESKIEQVCGMDKVGFFDAVETYDLLVDRVKKRAGQAGFEVVDFTGIFDDVTGWVFTDWCHLTNGANYLMAKALVNEVKTRVFKLELLPSDRIESPPDSYFTDYARKAKVLVERSDDRPGPARPERLSDQRRAGCKACKQPRNRGRPGQGRPLVPIQDRLGGRSVRACVVEGPALGGRQIPGMIGSSWIRRRRTISISGRDLSTMPQRKLRPVT